MLKINRTNRNAGLAIVSGGSSGIGLSCARILLDSGYSIAPLARNIGQLEAVWRKNISPKHQYNVVPCSVDVSNRGEVDDAVTASVRKFGAPAWLIASAGLAVPGEFQEESDQTFKSHMEVNYFGTLNLVRSVVPLMIANGGGRIVLISSAVALSGVYGYSAYAPSKFAVRGLGEVLDVELAQHGISVTVAFPPDTDTPQLENEQSSRPDATRHIASRAPTVSADYVARSIISAAEKRRFYVGPTLTVRLLYWLQGIVSCHHRRWQKRIVERSSKKRQRCS